MKKGFSLKKIFVPEEIIFAPTQECNLKCAHCFVSRTNEKLNIEKSLQFLKDAINDGVTRVGFSGGEPFLFLDFLYEISKAVVEAGVYFDKLMTNAVSFKDNACMKQAIEKIFDSGFDGTFGISFDAFHLQKIEKVADFIKTVEAVYKERNHVSLICTKKDSLNSKTILMLNQLAEKLGVSLKKDNSGFPVELIYKDKLETFMNDMLLYDIIPIETIDFIAKDALDESAWQSNSWFHEDFCSGPGHVYYIHSNGSVASCCGYANECDSLILGNINTMSYKEISENAKISCKKGFLRTVYKTGLLKEAKKLEKKRYVFPGKGRTKENCLFCRYFLQEFRGER